MKRGGTRVNGASVAGVIAGAALIAGARAQVSPPPYVGVVVGGPVSHGDTDCIPPWERSQAAERVDEFRRRHAPFDGSAGDGPNLFPFPPYGSNLFGDIAIAQYVDLDPTSPGILSWDCGQITYDGHTGSDNLIKGFSEMAIGIPVVAALDGMVEATDDGHFDMNTGCDNNPPANYVILDNGGGKETYYWHLKNGSVAVSAGQVVHAGQQIGLIGSSGCSDAPHLHFETHINGNVYEPYAGPCRAGPSGWQIQPAPPTQARLFEFGVTATNLANVQQFPYRYPTDPQIAMSTQNVYYWAMFHYMPPNSTWRFTFVRPDSTIEYQSQDVPFNYSTVLAFSIFYFTWNIPGMQSIPGTWHVLLDINDIQVIDAPVEVVQTITQGFNRAPLPITLAFDPVTPAPGAPVFCRVTSSLVLRDPDWDLVRYHYVWKRNGVTIRDVVSAGMADAIPGGATAAGDIVEVAATPNDGQVDGPAQTVRVAIGCYPNCDASSGTPRLNVADFVCFLQRFSLGDPYANCDGSTAQPVLNVADFTCFLQKYAAGCQ
jgi:Peptidase family M23